MSTPVAAAKKPADDGWSVATSRRNTHRRRQVPRKPGVYHRAECPPDDTDPDKHPVSKLVPRLCESVWYVKTLSKLERSLSGRSVSSLVCLGMGSMSIQKNARHQFACAILLARHFNLPPSSVVIYDPIMTPEDNSLVESFGYKVGSSEFDFDAASQDAGRRQVPEEKGPISEYRLPWQRVEED